MSTQTVAPYSQAVIEAAARNTDLAPMGSYLAHCSCDACLADAQRVAFLKGLDNSGVYHDFTSLVYRGTSTAELVERFASLHLAPAMDQITTEMLNTTTTYWSPGPTVVSPTMQIIQGAPLAQMAAPAAPRDIRAERIADMLNRGITPIPDDEVTDMGNYVIWDKYDPTCTLVLLDPSQIAGYYQTLENAANWYGSKEYVLNQKLRAYPDKPVRANGWFKENPYSYRHLWATRDRQYIDRYYNGRRNPGYESTTLEPRPGMERIERTALPVAERRAYLSALIQKTNSRGSMSNEMYDRLYRLNKTLFEPNVTATIEHRGIRVYGEQLKAIRGQLKQLGLLIANAADVDVGEFIEELDNLDYRIRDARRRNMIDAWNDRCSGGDELVVAGCGHVEREDDVHDVRNGTACDDCFQRDYVYVENQDEYDHRGNVYQHDDDLYYSYPQESDDDYDDDDDDDDDNVGGRIKSYSTNVLSYHNPDNKIAVSQYGDFLMGIELEVVPKRGYRRQTAIDTADSLCRDYAILKNDGSLESGGFEIVTAPRSLKEHVERFTKWKPHSHLRSWDPGCCGMHVHLSSKAFSQATLGKFIEFINARENDDLIIAIAGRHPKQGGNAESYCQREGALQVGNPKKTVQGKSSDRYRMVNTCNLGEREIERLALDNQESNGKSINTVELRIFRGTLNKARLLAQIEFAHAAVMFCRWSSMRELRQEHFLAWLRKTAGTYPNLAKWFGVRANNKTVDAAPKVRELEEI